MVENKDQSEASEEQALDELFDFDVSDDYRTARLETNGRYDSQDVIDAEDGLYAALASLQDYRQHDSPYDYAEAMDHIEAVWWILNDNMPDLGE